MKLILASLLALLATISAYAQPNIKAGEYFIGTFDPGAGSGTAFSAADGAWNEALEAVVAQAQSLAPGSSPALLNVRLKDNANNWGPVFKKVIFFDEVQTGTSNVSVSAAEFFFGNFDPGQGAGIVMPVFDNNFDEAVETVLKSQYVATLNASPILFNVRLRDANNAWGPVFKRVIFTEAVQSDERAVNVIQAEFFFGNFDPGQGSGTALLALDGNFNEAVESVLKSGYISSISASPVLFNIRVKDANGNWGPVFRKVIFNDDVVTDSRSVNITQAEFFFGNFDPGAGSGTTLLAMDSDFNEAVEAVLKSSYTAALTSSPVLFNIRVKDANNSWGPVFKKTIFFEDVRNDAREMEITQAEFFFGNFDPGMGTGSPIIAFDGELNEAVETVLRTSATWTATSGPILFNIRMRDGAGNWGPVFKRTIFPYGANTTLSLITQGESTSVCPGGSVSLNYTGPNGFTSTWFDGSTGSAITFTPQAEGYYGVTATNGSETYSDSILVSFLSAPSPVITPSGTILACSSSNITLSTPSVSGYTYQWLFNNTPMQLAANPTYMPTAYGSYAVSVTNTATGCSATSAPTVISTTSVISAVTGNGNCALPITLDASAGTGNTYQWYFNGNAISGAVGATYAANQAGNYSVQVTNGACASTSSPLTITGSITTPTIAASGPTVFCEGGSVTLTSSATSGNVWSNGATTPSITVEQGGAYSVTFSDGAGCSATSAVTTVTVNSLNTASAASSTPVICSGTALTPISIATTSATGIGSATGLPSGVTATWASNAITIAGSPLAAGTFTYTIPLVGGCGTVSAQGTITVNPTPGVTVNSATICQGASATLTATPMNAGNYTYAWTVPAGASNPGNVATVEATVAGNYAVSIRTNAAEACTSATANATLEILDNLDWVNLQFPASETICVGGSFSAYGQLYNNGDVNTAIPGAAAGVNVEFGYSTENSNPAGWSNWTAASFNTQSGNNDEYVGTLSGLGSGVYYYAFRYQINDCDWQYGGYSPDGGGIWDGGSFVSGALTVSEAPNAGTNANVSVCATGTPVNLFAYLGVQASNSGTWSGPSPLTGAYLGTFDPSASIAGNYVYSVSGNGCQDDEATITVAITTTNEASIDYPNVLCAGTTLPVVPVLTGSAGGTFSADNSGLIINANTGAIDLISSDAGSYAITYAIAGSSGCASFQTTASLEISESVTPVFSAVGPYCSGTNIAELPEVSTNGISGDWSPALNNSTTTTYTFTPVQGVCAFQAAIQVVVIPTPSNAIDISGNLMFCAGSSVTLEGAAADVYSWSNGSTAQSIEVNESGTYSLTLTNGGLCSVTSEPVAVEVVEFITFYADADMDGFGDLNTPVQGCDLLPGLSMNADDCDDSNASIYPSAQEACDGFDNNCNDLTDEGCVVEISGCMNPNACNYSSAATVDDNSCVFPGCMDPLACNYDALAGCDDGSCEVAGCMDNTACNYNASAACEDGSCVYMDVFEITGQQMPEAFTTHSYSYPCDAACSYAWSAQGGVIFGADDSCVVNVGWAGQGIGGLVLEVSCGGCTATVDFDALIQPVGVTESMETPVMTLYPNPTLNHTTLMISEQLLGSTMRIYSSSGALVQESSVNSTQMNIDAASWAAGVYSIQLVKNAQASENILLIKE